MFAQSSLAGQSARLVYSRTNEAAGCGDEAALRKAVARRLGYDPFVAASVNTVVAELRRDGDGLKARVYVVRDANMAGGARELASPTQDCTELMAAVALALSIAIDPDALDRVEPRAPTAAENAPNAANDADTSPAPPVPDAARSPEPRDDPRDAVTPKTLSQKPALAPAGPRSSAQKQPLLQAQLGAFVDAATGPLPAPSWGLGITAGVVLNRHWVAAIEPEWLPQVSKASANPSLGIRVGGFGGSLHAGYTHGPLYGGLYFEELRLSSEGYGIVSPRTDHSFWPSAGLRFGYEIRLIGALRLVPRLDGVLGLKRLTFQVDGASVHETPLAAARLGLALEARL